jgi:hypothetical protein
MMTSPVGERDHTPPAPRPPSRRLAPGTRLGQAGKMVQRLLLLALLAVGLAVALLDLWYG